jgi:hypothetical protein
MIALNGLSRLELNHCMKQPNNMDYKREDVRSQHRVEVRVAKRVEHDTNSLRFSSCT